MKILIFFDEWIIIKKNETVYIILKFVLEFVTEISLISGVRHHIGHTSLKSSLKGF